MWPKLGSLICNSLLFYTYLLSNISWIQHKINIIQVEPLNCHSNIKYIKYVYTLSNHDPYKTFYRLISMKSLLKDVSFFATFGRLLSYYFWLDIHVMFCAFCYHLYNLENVKNTHGRVILLVFDENFYFIPYFNHGALQGGPHC